ncbi:MAG TPA: S41 family peptidase, partial [Gammaproteobacteria bacterium]|nr:S41 family peptidase [Gammaproteobacteria bacterium]
MTPSPQRLAWLAAALLWLAAMGSARADTTFTRFPTLHGDSVVFEAYGNLWKVQRQGGTAARLTSDPGYDVMPRYSPDGKWIAFTGQYQGNTDVYVIPAAGGDARRLTFHSDVVDGAPERWGPDNMVLGWTPDSKQVVFLSRRSSMNSWFGRYFTVPVSGGPEELMPLDKGGMFSWSPDGSTIAYNRIFRNFRTWKRYAGGLHQNVWTHDFKTGADVQLTDWKGSDIDPMWYGNTVYFASDRGDDHRMNIWALDLGTKQTHEVTHFTDYDLDWPSLGDDGITFQQGGSLYVLDLPSEQLHKLSVDVPDDGRETGVRYVDASKFMQVNDPAGGNDFDVSPNGKRVLLVARGDLFTLPAEHGNTRDLTQTSGAKEENASWSPDGKWIAYQTDVSGEEEIAIRPSEGGAEQVLTEFRTGYFYRPLWSPDGSKLAFSDNLHQLWYLDVKSRKAVKVSQDKFSEIHDYTWSPDSRWLAWSQQRDNQQPGIWLYNLEAAKSTLVSSRFDADFNPAFDPDGKYLYFVSLRHENPTFSQSEFNVATLKMAGIYVATLDKDALSPFAPRSDEGAPAKDEKAGGGEQDKSKGTKPLHIDVDGLMARAVAVPIPADNIVGLTATSGHLYYETQPNATIEGPLSGEHSALHVFEVAKRKDKVLTTDLASYALSADGKTALINTQDGKFALLDTADGDAKPKDVDTSHMLMKVDPRAEWTEMFHMAWRLERDFFVNDKMNGVDWDAVRVKYGKLLPYVGHREDLDYLIGEIQGELSNSHTYVGGGDMNYGVTPVPTGLVGADYGVDPKSGRYYISKIYPGDNTKAEYLSPLTEPGVEAKVGDYVLAVNGHDLKLPTDIYSLFVGTRGETVTLTLADDAAGKGRHDVTVKTLHDEGTIRQDDWIRHNREYVSKASGGKIGYVYLDDMGANGMKQFIDQFYPQIDKQGLIVDDRFNGGGFIDQILLERLRRVLAGMTADREGAPGTEPQVLSYSYKACLINEYSASDGDIFPYYFRKYGLGPLIGMRTWGGVRGIRGDWQLLDNGYITVPESTEFGLDSQWVMENHGVDPDIQVDDLPGDVVKGRDAQLDTAI